MAYSSNLLGRAIWKWQTGTVVYVDRHMQGCSLQIGWARGITAHLGTQDYWRLRIGIGHPGDKNEVVDYVLKPPRKEERGEIDAALDRALLAWPLLARSDFEAATQRINSKPPAATKENQ